MKIPGLFAVAIGAVVLATPAAAQSYGSYGGRSHCPERCCPDHCGQGHSGGGYGGGYGSGYNPLRSTQTGGYSSGYSSYSYSNRYSYSSRESYSYAAAPPSYYSGGVGYGDDRSHRWHRGAVLPADYRNDWYVRDYTRYGYAPPPEDCGYYRTDSGQVVVARLHTGEIVHLVDGY